MAAVAELPNPAVHRAGYPDRPMRYRLIVLTHGNHETLARTVASFRQHVTPDPVDRVLCVDAKAPSGFPCIVHPYFEDGVTRWSGGPHGFCEALLSAWTLYGGNFATGVHGLEPADYVFYLEHDFVFTRDVDLRLLARVLDRHGDVAQMSLMRDAVSHPEREAGSLVASRPPGTFVFQPDWDEELGNLPWLEHRAYFTTNPSLMTRDFMTMNVPRYEDGSCEGKFGIDLLQRGYRFGVWGAGETWVNHIGHRDGFGY